MSLSWHSVQDSDASSLRFCYLISTQPAFIATDSEAGQSILPCKLWSYPEARLYFEVFFLFWCAAQVVSQHFDEGISSLCSPCCWWRYPWYSGSPAWLFISSSSLCIDITDIYIFFFHIAPIISMQLEKSLLCSNIVCCSLHSGTNDCWIVCSVVSSCSHELQLAKYLSTCGCKGVAFFFSISNKSECIIRKLD